MSMQTNLHGRLRNTSLPRSHGLLPLFEAVINSIHSTEDANLAPGQGKIVIEINRSSQKAFDFKNEEEAKGRNLLADIAGFTVTDNGIGFNDTNMESFETLDSDFKVNRGPRGYSTRIIWNPAYLNFRNHFIASSINADNRLFSENDPKTFRAFRASISGSGRSIRLISKG